MNFPPNTERWRPLVAKYFKPEDVDKALWVILYESKGDAGDTTGDGGHSIGLFQMNRSRGLGSGSTVAQLTDPDYNVRLAAQSVYGGGGWSAWGENNTYNGQKFGALGNHPYPGDTGTVRADSGGGTMPGPTTGPPTAGQWYRNPNIDAAYQKLRAESQAAHDKYMRTQSKADENAWLDAAATQSDFESNMGRPDASPTDAADEQRRQLASGIALGDFNAREADRAYTRWSDRAGRASDAAQAEIAAAERGNANEIAMQKAREGSKTPSLLSIGRGGSYTVPSYKEAFDRWKKEFGGDEPAMNPQSATGYSGGGGGGGGVLDYAPQPTDTPPIDNGSPARIVRDFPHPSGLDTPGGTGQFTPPPGWQDSQSSAGKSAYQRAGSALGYGADLTYDTGSALAGLASDVGSKTKNTVLSKKWWQKRHFAGGGTNLPAGPALVGEKGPEILHVPGFGSKIVGQHGPEDVQIPQGANIIPANEAFAYQEIKKAAQEQPDPVQQRMEGNQRAMDPELATKAVKALVDAMGAYFANNPKSTPVLEDPTQQPDLWADWRPMTGIDAYGQQMRPATPTKGAR